MKNYIVIISMLFGLLIFSSCTQDDNSHLSERQTNPPARTSLSVERVLTENNFSEFIKKVDENLDKNQKFVAEFIRDAEDNKLEKDQMSKMLNLLNISEDLNVERLDKLNIVNGTYLELKERENKPLGDDCDDTCIEDLPECEKLVKIRDAMLEECGKYPWGVDETCKAAVMIAYWYKSSNC